MEHREIEEKIRTAVEQTAPNQLEDILSRCEGDTEAPIRLPRSTRRRPALAALAALVLVALGLGLFPMGGRTLPTLRQKDPVPPTAPVAAVTPTQSVKATSAPSLSPTAPAAAHTPVPSGVPIVFPADSPAPTESPSAIPAKSSYIGPDAALHAALLALNLDYEELPYHTEELDWDDGVVVYDVDICHNGVEYSCEIDACTGDCRGWEQDVCDHADHQGSHHEEHHDQPSPSPANLIGQDAALTAACTHLSCSAADLLDPKVELDTEDGQNIYEVEFCHNGTEYELELDACTGRVLKQDSEPCDEVSHGHHSQSSTDHHSSHHAEHH